MDAWPTRASAADQEIRPTWRSVRWASAPVPYGRITVGTIPAIPASPVVIDTKGSYTGSAWEENRKEHHETYCPGLHAQEPAERTSYRSCANCNQDQRTESRASRASRRNHARPSNYAAAHRASNHEILGPEGRQAVGGLYGQPRGRSSQTYSAAHE